MLNVLVATINHNLPELTDNIVNQFYKNEKHSENKLDLMVVDNGSEPLKQSKHTSLARRTLPLAYPLFHSKIPSPHPTTCYD